MYFKKGTYRYVWLWPAVGLAIKLPRFRWRRTYRTLIHHCKNPSWFKREIFEYNVYTHGTLKQNLFSGIFDNWLEYSFYRKYKNIFCQPTYFSLFGLINLQKCGHAYEMDQIDFWVHLHILTNGKAWRSPHHFSNIDNFSYENARLTMLDYGDPKVQEVVSAFGQKIWEEFDLNFKRAKEEDASVGDTQ